MQMNFDKNQNMEGNKIIKIENKRLLLYNAKQEILVYFFPKKPTISFPNSDGDKNEDLYEKIKTQLGIELAENNLEEIMTLIEYKKFFISENKKLKEAYKKYINRYYSFYIDLDSDTLSRLIECSIECSKYEYLNFIFIDKLIRYSKNEKLMHTPVLQKLKNKLEYKEY